ncbi:MAG TPA: hypothetical protein VFG54_12260 [Prolixibacteraceae bacterium]|nr:hypothetical protein [Prolixibacteraceae bacterium]
MKKQEFDLNYQYQLYLDRVKLKESQMAPVQRTELKRAFFGACGQMLMLLRDDIGKLEEDEAIKELDGMINQVSDFWLTETKRVN